MVIVESSWWLHILGGRTLIGVSEGLICVGCPMLLSELAPIQSRGLLISINQLMITIGIVIGTVTIFFSSSRWNSDTSFEVPLLVGAAIAVLYCSVIAIVPESPVWRLSRGDVDGATKSISRARHLPKNDTSVEKCMVMLAAKTTLQDVRHVSVWSGEPKYWLRTLTGIAVSALQQLTGINYFFYFGTSIFRTVGVSNVYLVGIFFGCVNLVFSVVALGAVAAFKRTRLLMAGSILLACFMLIFTTVGITSSTTDAGAVTMIVSSCAFIGTFASTWGPLTSIVISELYPPPIKVQAMGICGCVGWLATFMVSFLIPTLTRYLGFALGYIFLACIVLSVMVVYRYVPETRHVDVGTLDSLYFEDRYSAF